MLRNTSMLDIVSDTVRQGALIGWVGYGFEGMDTEIFFNRMAMYEYCALVQKYRKDRGGKKLKIKGTKGRIQLYELLQMNEDALQKMGIKNKVHRKRIVAMAQIIQEGTFEKMMFFKF
jgi:hypothetical protein